MATEKRDCGDCDGTGNEMCRTCENDGMVECVCTCGDVHQQECPDCWGIFPRPCEACGGSGKAVITDIDLESGGQLTIMDKISEMEGAR